jgi:hypothetical protein
VILKEQSKMIADLIFRLKATFITPFNTKLALHKPREFKFRELLHYK